jgi:aminoglycoside phosphotransferase (APT) family kinase protein
MVVVAVASAGDGWREFCNLPTPMATLARRDDGALRSGFTRWCAARWPDLAFVVAELNRPSAGWSNETLLVTMSSPTRDRRERFVVRLPPPLLTYPSYDLAAQAAVLEALTSGPIPVPHVVAFEADDQWLGAPFLVMTHEPGRPGAEAPALDPWVMDAPLEQQARVHDGFVTTLASIHRVDWRVAGLDRVVRGGERSLVPEITWWTEYVDWASDGAPTAALAETLAWCATTAPVSEPAASLCWGDARLGNLLFTDDGRVSSVLDWELASIGAAELDLAWYLALDELTTHFTGGPVPGFLTRSDVIARYEQRLGRVVTDLEWHEIFALARSVAINERQARLAARSDIPYPGVAGDRNPVLRHLVRRVDAFPSDPRGG